VGLTIDRDIRRAQMGEKEWELNIFTQLANGCSGFEASPFFNTWGPRWEGGALVESDGSLTENGRAAKAVMDKVQAIAPYMAHYDRHEDIAVYHDAAFQSRLNIGIGMGLSQSKVGTYTLIRELGYHAEPLPSRPKSRRPSASTCAAAGRCWQSTAPRARASRAATATSSRGRSRSVPRSAHSRTRRPKHTSEMCWASSRAAAALAMSWSSRIC
jgi:hypothetical protein